ncbi:MAG TPA: septal ring lytic transglycosylase RlpA family protein [Stellaceae bacterium]|nr:septal ring lytic transglycosylase RlpA family protein [Stellaceae bacterium]
MVIALAASALAAPRADAATVASVGAGATQKAQTSLPPKIAARRMYERLAGPLACRDSGKLRMGLASWYAGFRTASGESFRADGLTAASRILPFNTRIRVTNLRNGRSVVVRINDRGPYVRGRVVDLTPRAATTLGMKMHGTAPVYIEIVRRETQSAATDSINFERR